MRIDPTPGRASSSERIVAFALAASLLVAVAWLATPAYNWDMLGYLGVAERLNGSTGDEAHRLAYEAMRAGTPDAQRAALERGSAFRATVARDPAAFVEQLPFYAVKPVYPLLLAGASRVGLDPLGSGLALARLSYVALGLLLLAWLTRSVRPAIAAPIALGAAATSPMVELARLFTPDAMSSALLLAALWLAIGREAPRAGLIVSLLAIPLRPDNAMFAVILAALVALTIPQRRQMAAVAAAAAVASYFALGRTFGGHPWSTLFFHTFVEYQPFPASFDSPLGLTGYARIYLWRLHPAHLPPALAPFVLFGLLAAAWHALRSGPRSRWVTLLAAMAVFVVGHWLLFPLQSDRFFVVPYLVVVLAAVDAAFGADRLSAR